MKGTLKKYIRNMAGFPKMKAHLEVILLSLFSVFFGPAAVPMPFHSFTRSEALNRDLPLRTVPCGPVSHCCVQEIWLEPEAYGQALSQPLTPALPACLRSDMKCCLRVQFSRKAVKSMSPEVKASFQKHSTILLESFLNTWLPC